MEPEITGAEAVVVEPTMEEVEANGGTPEVIPEPAEVVATPEVTPTLEDTPSDPAQDAVQKRINKITADKYTEKRRADELQAKVEALESANKVLPNDIPKEEDFDFDADKYNQAMIQYEVRKQLEVNQQATSQQQTEQVRQKLADDFFTKQAAYSSEHPGYDEALKTLPTFDQETLSAIYELGPQVVHYMTKNLDAADQIANSSPTMAAVKLGQISMGLTADTKTVKPTNAPEPVEVISGGASVTKSQEDMSMDEIMALP